MQTIRVVAMEVRLIDQLTVSSDQQGVKVGVFVGFDGLRDGP